MPEARASRLNPTETVDETYRREVLMRQIVENSSKPQGTPLKTSLIL